jgi:hypothetical protein
MVADVSAIPEVPVAESNNRSDIDPWAKICGDSVRSGINGRLDEPPLAC